MEDSENETSYFKLLKPYSMLFVKERKIIRPQLTTKIPTEGKSFSERNQLKVILPV